MVWTTIWSAFKWLVGNLVYVLAAIGLASVIVRSIDEAVERHIARFPENRFWKWLDRALDTGDGVLGAVLDLLHKFALRQKAPGDETQLPPKV